MASTIHSADSSSRPTNPSTVRISGPRPARQRVVHGAGGRRDAVARIIGQVRAFGLAGVVIEQHQQVALVLHVAVQGGRSDTDRGGEPSDGHARAARHDPGGPRPCPARHRRPRPSDSAGAGSARPRPGRARLRGLPAGRAGESVGSLFSAPLSDPTLMAALRELPLGPHDRLPHPGSPAAGRIRNSPAAPPTTVLPQQQLRAGGIDSRLVLHAPATHFTILESTRPEARIFLAHVLPARES